MDETDILLSADHYVTPGTSKPGRLEDVFQDETIKAFTSIGSFKMFARSCRGLCLDDHDIEDVIDKGNVSELKLELLKMWREKNGKQATVLKIRSLVECYKKGDDQEGEQAIVLNIRDLVASYKKGDDPEGEQATTLKIRNLLESYKKEDDPEDNSRPNILDVENEGIDCSTTHNIKSASNFQPTMNIGKGFKSGQSEDSGLQKRNESAESWRRKFLSLCKISIGLVVLVVALTSICTTTPDVTKKKQEMELRNDELNEQIQNLAQKKDSETREMAMRIDELNVQLQNMTKEKDSAENTEIREMKLQIDELNEQIQNLKQERDSVAPEFIPCIIYEKNCFWKEVHASMDTTVTEASKICTDKNSRLADIYSEEHYNMIMNYIRTDRNVWVWRECKSNIRILRPYCQTVEQLLSLNQEPKLPNGIQLFQHIRTCICLCAQLRLKIREWELKGLPGNYKERCVSHSKF